MPCNEAMIPAEKVISATPETTLAEALDLFETHSVRSLPILDQGNKFVGLFNFHRLLTTILPFSADMGRGSKGLEISLNHVSGQTCWVSGRLQEYLNHPLSDLMVKNAATVTPDTPLREGVRLLALQGSPLPVVDEETNQLVGLISSQSALKVLSEMKVNLKRN